MSAQIFIDKLEASNLLDSEIIGKLRKKIAKPGKTPQAQAVANYCLEKGYLTESQASKLLDSVSNDVAAHRSAMAQPLDVLDDGTGPSVISVDDLVVDGDLQPAGLGQDDVVDLSAAPMVGAPIEAVADIVDPFGVPVQGAAPVAADPYSGNGGTNLDEKPDKDAPKDKFQGKRVVEQSFESRWILLGSFLLVFLILAGLFFFLVLSKGNSDEVFGDAEAKFDAESYPAAIESYKEFIKNFSGDKNVAYARVKYRLAEMKVAASGKDVERIISVFQDNIEEITALMADQIDDKPFEDEIKSNIAYDTVVSAQKSSVYASNAKTVEEKQTALDKAKKMMRLVNDGKFVPRAERESSAIASIIESTDAKLSEVENAIVQEQDTTAAITEIDGQLAAGKTYDAFQTYDKLVTKHPSADADGRIVKSVQKISDKEQSLVTQVNTEVSNFPDVTVETSPAFLNRVSIPTLTGKEFAPLKGEVGAFLVSGSVYGVDVGEGKVLWRQFVGYETEIDPVMLADPKRVLISDQKNNRLMLIDPSNGDVVWNKSVGEPFLKPTISRNRIFLSTTSGKVARIDSESGAVSAMVQLPQRLTVPATANASGNVLYQVGEHLNLYVMNVSLTNMTCVQALYVGHRDGGILTAPTLLQDILVVPVNKSPTKCDLRIYTKEADSTKLRVAGDTRELKGIIVKKPILHGNYLTTITQNGELEVFEIASEDNIFSLASVAAKSLNLPTSQEVFLAAMDAKIWVGTRGITQFDRIRSKQEIKDQTVRNNADYFVGEMLTYDGLLVHVRKRAGSQMTSISGVDPSSLKEIWRLDLGGSLAGPPITGNESVIAANSQGDLFKIDDAAISAGVSHSYILRASKSQQNLVFSRSVEFGDGSALLIGPSDRKDAVSYKPSNSALPITLSELKIDDLKITCDPIEFRNGALIGLNNGEFRHVVPRSTEADAVFVPKAKIGEEFMWQRPCIISNDMFAVVSQRGRIFTVKFMPGDGKPFMTPVSDANIGRNVVGPLVMNGSTLFTLCDGPSGNELIAINLADLKIKGSYPLGGISTWGPEKAGQMVLVTKEDGTLVGFNEDITNPIFQTKLPSGRVAGMPLSWNGKTVLTLKDGKIVVLDLATEDGEIKTIDSGEPVMSDSSVSGNRLYVNGADGSVGVFDLSKVE